MALKKNKSLFMETTNIPISRTVAQIQELLGAHGVCGVMTEYHQKEVDAVCFKVMFLDRTIPFRLPCRWQAIYHIFLERKKYMTLDVEIQHKMQDQAKRVAWRQIFRWTEAQLALVETDMVKVYEVFLPYMQTGLNETLSERFEKSGFTLLEAPK